MWTSSLKPVYQNKCPKKKTINKCPGHQTSLYSWVTGDNRFKKKKGKDSTVLKSIGKQYSLEQ